MKIKIKYLSLMIVLFAIVGFNTIQTKHETVVQNKIYKVAILYPNGDDKTFDMEYYENKHMPMMAELLGKNLKFYEIDKGLSGRTPADKIPFLAIGYFYINDVGEYNKAIAQNIDTILSDIKKYTNIQPIIQVSEIIHSRDDKTK